jgi:hypothetical protein
MASLDVGIGTRGATVAGKMMSLIVAFPIILVIESLGIPLKLRPLVATVSTWHTRRATRYAQKEGVFPHLSFYPRGAIGARIRSNTQACCAVNDFRQVGTPVIRFVQYVRVMAAENYFMNVRLH